MNLLFFSYICVVVAAAAAAISTKKMISHSNKNEKKTIKMSPFCRQIKTAKEKHFREQLTFPNNPKKPAPYPIESKKCGFGF